MSVEAPGPETQEQQLASPQVSETIAALDDAQRTLNEARVINGGPIYADDLKDTTALPDNPRSMNANMRNIETPSTSVQIDTSIYDGKRIKVYKQSEPTGDYSAAPVDIDKPYPTRARDIPPRKVVVRHPGVSVTRKDAEGNIVYEGRINNEKATEIVARRALKDVGRVAAEHMKSSGTQAA